MTTLRNVRLALAILIGAFLITACGDATGPAKGESLSGTYNLVTVFGLPLPFTGTQSGCQVNGTDGMGEWTSHRIEASSYTFKSNGEVHYRASVQLQCGLFDEPVTGWTPRVIDQSAFYRLVGSEIRMYRSVDDRNADEPHAVAMLEGNEITSKDGVFRYRKQ
jgi:hypothetical protein